MSRAIAKYLSLHAEPESRELGNFPAGRHFAHCVVIPACRELPDFLDQFGTSPFAGSLVILVINQPADNVGGGAPDALNIRLAGRVRRLGEVVWQHGNLLLVDCGSFGVLAVDRFTDRPLPKRQGVGLARKIGCDIAVALYDRGFLRSTVIHTTDADASLPRDYFRRPALSSHCSAWVYPFLHACDESPLGRATTIYERSLRYYVAALQWCGSPYAFHTIGSCIAVSIERYCQARGFPRRNGGEDFYLLNKLAKLGPVAAVEGEPVRLAARESDRVPFGTGPAVAGIMAREISLPPAYDPRIFVHLRQVLACFPSLCLAIGNGNTEGWLNRLNEEARHGMTALKVEDLFAHLIGQGLDGEQVIRHAHIWFDAFRTLKFVHFLQREYYRPVPLEDAERGLFALQTGNVENPWPVLAET